MPFRIKLSILVLALGSAGAQTGVRKMPVLYRSSPQNVVVPAQAPVSIRSGSPSSVGAAPAPSANGTLRVFVNGAMNSRVAFRGGAAALTLAWKHELPERFTARTVLTGGGSVVVYGPSGWLLLDTAGRSLGSGRGVGGDLLLDPANRVFYTADDTGYIEALSLANGRREYFLEALFGEDFRRVLISRTGRRMLIVSSELPANPHAPRPDNSVIELQDLGEGVAISGSGRLKSAKRVDHLTASTTHVIPAVQGDTVVLAMEGSIYVADLNLKLQRRLTGDFQPLFLSMDELRRLYLVVRVAEKPELWVLNESGERITRTVLPESFLPIAPAIIGLDHSVYLISRNRVLSIASDGTVRWDHVPAAQISGAVVTPSGTLLATVGSELLAYDSTGRHTSLFRTQDDDLLTAPAFSEKNEVLIGGSRRIYCLR
ncbi:MAG TPA: hypothetical protein VEQ63_12000 [Bryobacteraceae bacterium]|nr:hypothetical protein [Bryobacteraceae bacterium]